MPPSVYIIKEKSNHHQHDEDDDDEDDDNDLSDDHDEGNSHEITKLSRDFENAFSEALESEQEKARAEDAAQEPVVYPEDDRGGPYLDRSTYYTNSRQEWKSRLGDQHWEGKPTYKTRPPVNYGGDERPGYEEDVDETNSGPGSRNDELNRVPHYQEITPPLRYGVGNQARDPSYDAEAVREAHTHSERYRGRGVSDSGGLPEFTKLGHRGFPKIHSAMEENRVPSDDEKKGRSEHHPLTRKKYSGNAHSEQKVKQGQDKTASKIHGHWRKMYRLKVTPKRGKHGGKRGDRDRHLTASSTGGNKANTRHQTDKSGASKTARKQGESDAFLKQMLTSNGNTFGATLGEVYAELAANKGVQFLIQPYKKKRPSHHDRHSQEDRLQGKAGKRLPHQGDSHHKHARKYQRKMVKTTPKDMNTERRTRIKNPKQARKQRASHLKRSSESHHRRKLRDDYEVPLIEEISPNSMEYGYWGPWEA